MSKMESQRQQGEESILRSTRRPVISEVYDPHMLDFTMMMKSSSNNENKQEIALCSLKANVLSKLYHFQLNFEHELIYDLYTSSDVQEAFQALQRLSLKDHRTDP